MRRRSGGVVRFRPTPHPDASTAGHIKDAGIVDATAKNQHRLMMAGADHLGLLSGARLCRWAIRRSLTFAQDRFLNVRRAVLTGAVLSLSVSLIPFPRYQEKRYANPNGSSTDQRIGHKSCGLRDCLRRGQLALFLRWRR